MSVTNTNSENIKGMVMSKNIGAFMKLLYLHCKTTVVKIVGLTRWGEINTHTHELNET